MSVFISILLTIIGCLYRRSKVVAILIMVWMWVLWGWNSTNGDYDAYRALYDNVIFLTSIDYEPGYKYLMLLGHAFSFSFQEFLQFVSAIVVLLWGIFILKVSKTPALFFSIFLWTYFPLDYVLIRNSLSFAIVIQGIAGILMQTKRSMLKFILLVLLGSTFHTSALFYLVFIGLPFIRRLPRVVFLGILIICCLCLLFFQGSLVNFVHDQTEGRTETYATTIYLVLLYSIFDIANYKYISAMSLSTRNKDISLSSVFNKLRDFNGLLLLLIPLFFLAGILIRLLRNITIVNTVVLCNYFSENNYKIRQLVAFGIYLVILYYYFIIPVYEYTIEPLYTSNLLFN